MYNKGEVVSSLSSTYKVFKTMDYGSEKRNLSVQSQIWINDHKNLRSDQFDSLIVDEEKVVDVYNMHFNLKSLAEVVAEKKEFLADVFMQLSPVYSRNCVVRLIQELIQHIEYFAQRLMLVRKNETIVIKKLYMDCLSSLPLRRISTFVIPALAQGFVGHFGIVLSKHHYFEMLLDLLYEARYPNVCMLKLKEVENLCAQDLCPKTEVKMLIFEDSDLHSAVDIIVDAIWNIPEKVPYVLVNVFAQESVNSEFCNMLKQRMQQYADQAIKYIIPEETSSDGTKCFDNARNEYKSIVESGFRNAFEVFKVGGSKSAIPATVLFNCQIKTAFSYPLPVIAVDGFRTETEALALSSNSIGRVASVWTESGSCARRVANALEVDTVWINGFDLVHPVMSELLSLDSKYLQEIPRHDPSAPVESDVIENPSFAELLKSWESAEAAVLNWTNCKTRGKVLADASKNLNKLENTKFASLQKIFSVWSAIPALNGKYVSNEAFNIEVITRPRGIVCIELVEKLPLSDSVYVITASVAFGNCVLVSVPADLYQDLMEWAQICKFPNGIVNIFLQCDVGSVEPIEHTYISLDKLLLLSFNKRKFNEIEFTKLFGKFYSKKINQLEYVYIEDVQKLTIEQIEQMLTRPKFVWYPNQ